MLEMTFAELSKLAAEFTAHNRRRPEYLYVSSATREQMFDRMVGALLSAEEYQLALEKGELEYDPDEPMRFMSASVVAADLPNGQYVYA